MTSSIVNTGRRDGKQNNTSGHWFGDATCPGFGWVSLPDSGDLSSGVLILPPFAYEYWTTHHTLQELQEELCRDGHLVMKMDYTGTGDAAGNLWDPDRLSKWHQEVTAAVTQLRAWGAKRITVVGLRLGALLALYAAQSVEVDHVIAWVPVASGRRYVRELRLMANNADAIHPIANSACCYVAGIVLTESFLADLSKLNLEGKLVCNKVTIIDRAEAPAAAAYADSLRAQAVELEYIALDDAAIMLDVATEEGGVARRSVDCIREKIRQSTEQRSRDQRSRITDVSATWTVDGVRITEQQIRLTDAGLSAIQTIPESERSGYTIVFLNTGSEKHVGPGRAWVEFARTLATRGHTCIRVDFQGWGESPDNGLRPGRPYAIHGVADTRHIVDSLRESGHDRIVLVGVCAGAWIALRDCAALCIEGMVAFNPQLYYETTDPDLPNMKITRIWYDAECVKESWPARREAVTEWISKIESVSYPVDFWFEQGDPGIYYLEHELPDLLRKLTGSSPLSVHMLPQLDHSMHRHWLRQEAIDAIDHLLARINKRLR